MTDTRGASLGLYLSPDVVVAAFVRVSRGTPHVVAVGTTPTPRGAMEGSAVRDPAHLGQAIRTLLRSMRSRAAAAYVVLPPSAAGMRSFRLPQVPDRERRPMVRGELETSGALPIGAGAFGFLWTKAPEEEEREEADVFAFYIEDAAVDAVREALRVAGLRLESIEPYSVATMRAFLHTRPRVEPVALLCPSDTHSDLCIHDGAQVRYVRRIAGGWEDMRYTHSAAGEPAAESVSAATRPVPLGGEEETAAASPGGGVATGLAAPAESSTRMFLASDVSRSFAFYSREYKDADVPRSLVVLAPRRYAEDIAETMVSTIPVPVIAEDLADTLEVPETSEGIVGTLGFAAAAGTCMVDGGALLPRVDISRQEAAALTRRQAPSVLLMGMAGSTVWMVASLLAAVALSFMQSSAEVENNLLRRELEEEWARHAGPLRNQEVFNAARKVQTEVALPASAALAAVAVAHTHGLSVKSIRLETGSKVTVEGTALAPESMQEFADNLGKTGAVKNPTFETMHQDADGLFTFRITGSCAGLSPEGTPVGGGG